MKKLLTFLFIILLILLLTGCSNTAKGVVENYLDNYINLDDNVLSNMKNIIKNENLNEENENLYEEVFNKQYSNLKYEIVSEQYDGDEAIITAKVTVYDFYNAQKSANDFLKKNPDYFNDDNGNYDINKFIEYKLKQMNLETSTIDYTIDFYVINTSDGWQLSELSETDLEKIHGIYNYES